MAAYETLTEASDLVFFRPATLEDLDRIAALEAAGYPPDEAASREKMEYRLERAADLFMAAVKAGTNQVIGYTCATATAKEQLEEETMSVHEPEGTTVCIHSVCVAADEQRNGVATRMLKAYIQWVQQSFPSATNLQLICKAEKKDLYERVGFELVGPSKVVHGSDPWLDYKLVL
mmetsp:Transcript_21602/g.60031  ORF Transcript_21602/g.60031 Transcript_21602/m.60031 type:complete len:175 (+) Transcript_21602:334-858(+)